MIGSDLAFVRDLVDEATKDYEKVRTEVRKSLHTLEFLQIRQEDEADYKQFLRALRRPWREVGEKIDDYISKAVAKLEDKTQPVPPGDRAAIYSEIIRLRQLREMNEELGTQLGVKEFD